MQEFLQETAQVVSFLQQCFVNFNSIQPEKSLKKKKVKKTTKKVKADEEAEQEEKLTKKPKKVAKKKMMEKTSQSLLEDFLGPADPEVVSGEYDPL